MRSALTLSVWALGLGLVAAGADWLPTTTTISWATFQVTYHSTYTAWPTPTAWATYTMTTVSCLGPMQTSSCPTESQTTCLVTATSPVGVTTGSTTWVETFTSLAESSSWGPVASWSSGFATTMATTATAMAVETGWPANSTFSAASTATSSPSAVATGGAGRAHDRSATFAAAVMGVIAMML